MGALYESYKMVESNEGQVVQTISSREVAEMMEMQHKNLIAKIEKILPAHLKANPIDITLHGEAMVGFDFNHSGWNFDKILFNVLQLGIPENKQPIIKI